VRDSPEGRVCVALGIVLMLCALALASSVDGARAAEQRGPLELLCGIAQPIDALLHCARDSTGNEPAPEQHGDDGAQPVSGAGVNETPPVSATTPRYVDDLLLVKFRPTASSREQESALRDAGVEPVRRIAKLNVTVVQMPAARRDAALVRLRSSSAVSFVEKDAVVERLATTPNDTNWPLQWGLRQADFPAAWDRTRGADSVVVAVLDTGVDGTVPDLQDSVRGGYNALTPEVAAADDNGHGTAVAGVIAARTNNREGIAGICWTCSVLPIKVLAASGIGDTVFVAAGIVHAVDAGARVITMSLGGPADEETLDQAVAYALARGAILVAAAGNAGTSTPFYPAAIPGVISVAASDQSDRLYSWSSFGDTVDVAAPGCNPAPSSTGGYVQFCGTSSATPVVAGLVALMLSLRPAAARETVIAAIDSTALPIAGGIRHGRIDAAAALAAFAGATPSSPSTAPASNAEQSSTRTLRGRLSRSVSARAYRRSIEGALTTAILRFTGQRVLTLAIRGGTGAILARVRGRSPLRLAHELPPGTYDFVISGRRAKAAFSLVYAARVQRP